MTDKFINLIGLTEVAPKGREISYESLTSVFDGYDNFDKMMNLVVYHFSLIRSAVKSRESKSGQKEAMTELEEKKLSFLFALVRNLESLGVKSDSKEINQLKAMTWLEEGS